MCGIAGWVSEREHPRAVLAAMNEAQAHRGPDAGGEAHVGRAHLGHRRLSIIDLAGSPQPMVSADGAHTLVFNGEIYNFRDLRGELAALGRRFVSGGDTEVLLQAWEQWGPECVGRLQGMFAFAVWDAPRQRLFAARDHLGVKPFHWWWDGATFVFASEIKALLAHPAVRREVDPDAISLYLERQYVPGPRTVWRGVRKLPPGHCLELGADGPRERRYWAPTWRDKLALGDDEAVAAVEGELRRSVASMLVADVPLGAFLSGGVDSSVVAALMVQARGAGVRTFTLGFAGDGAGSEHPHAEAVARHLGCDHTTLMIAADDVLREVDGLAGHYDEPFGDQAALPTLLLARLTRKHVTVALTGEGADEVFAGYETYPKRVREDAWCRALAGRWSPLPALVRALPGALRKDRLLRALARPPAERYASMPGHFHEELQRTLYRPAFLAARTATAARVAAEHLRASDASDPLDRMLAIDSAMWLPDDLLTKVDIATMAASLEARVPYLDHRVVGFAARLPTAMKARGSTTKWVLKRIAERHLPHAIVHRRKSGFTMPLGRWLNEGLRGFVDDALSEGGLLGRGLLQPAPVRRLLAGHRAGKRGRGFRLWNLCMLEHWFRRHAPDWRLS